MAARRTKIVATLGPRSNELETLRPLVEHGVDVCRLNFAHATPERHRRTAEIVRSVVRETGKVVGLLADLPGPKMRTGPVAGGEIELAAGSEFVLTTEDVEGDEKHVATSVDNLASLVSAGDEIFLADGAIVLSVEDIDDSDVITEVVRGGTLRTRKGMHLPGAERSVEAFTESDHGALDLALSLRANMVGLSFVRDADDIKRVREVLPKRGHRPMLVAKIETRSAVENLDGIVADADAVMVARGDLGIQTSLTRVPLLQKEIIHLCNRAGKPVITATQMLESMTRAPLPTRAEVADIANAVVDGTDALMLSEETAVGDFPVAAVDTMSQTAEMAEEWPSEHERFQHGASKEDPVSWAVANAAVLAAEHLGVAAILCPTRSGATPQRVAAFRPRAPIVALSERPETLGRLALMWGVTPVNMRSWLELKDETEDIRSTVAAATVAGLCVQGDLVVIVAGAPGPRAGRTDFMRVVRV